MVEVNEPQVWTLISVFSVALFGMLAVVSGLFTRLLRTEIDSLRSEIRSEFGSVRSEMTHLGSEQRSATASLRSELRSEIGRVSEQVEGLRREFTVKLETLDRDVQAIALRVFPDRD